MIPGSFRIGIAILVVVVGGAIWFVLTSGKTGAGHSEMVDLLASVAESAESDNLFTETSSVERLKEIVNSSGWSDCSPEDRYRTLHSLAHQQSKLGLEMDAIATLSEALESVDTLPVRFRRGAKEKSFFDLGVAWMRYGETVNCCARQNPDSCLLPIRGGGLHRERVPSRNAMEYFEQLMRLTNSPARLDMNLKARWLYNIAAMTIDAYPDGVAGSFRIPPPRNSGGREFPRFPNISGQTGLDLFDMAGGVAADDFDNDGDIDLMLSTWDTRGQLRYFLNDGEGNFAEKTDSSGLGGITGGLNLVQADYDNDGWLDLLVLRGAWQFQSGRIPNSLLRNNGDGTFTDTTFRSGLGEVHYPTQTAAWSDFDRDGDLDLYIGNESPPSGVFEAYGPERELPGEKFPSQLFRNEGDGRFVDIAASAGVENDRTAKGVTWGDFDDDGYDDLFVSNLLGENRLYHNQGDGTFEDIAPSAGLTKPFLSFATWFWDVNNDGLLDIYVGSYDGGLEDFVKQQLGLRPTREVSCLYLGDGRGGFRDAAGDFGIEGIYKPMGANFGDIDHDGFLDFYLGTGMPGYEYVIPNQMFLNLGGRAFADVSYTGGFAHLQKGHGISFADFDGDGDQDIYHQLGGAFPGDRYYNALFQNPGFGNYWVGVSLRGTDSNRFGMGSRIRVRVRENGRTRDIYRWVNSGGSFGANPLLQSIGVGTAEEIEELEIRWHASGKTSLLRGLPVGEIAEVVEPR